jgi:hypothetical protein
MTMVLTIKGRLLISLSMLPYSQYKRVDAYPYPLDDRPTGINLYVIDGQLL